VLRRLCASACDRPVVAGPVEATVVGNALVQAIAHSSLSGLAQGRELVRRVLPIETVSPERIADWAALEQRLDATLTRGS
jgi:rhamnulokinase